VATALPPCGPGGALWISTLALDTPFGDYHLAQFRTYFCWLSMGFGSPWLHRVT
jgi:hypothetical protein